MTSEAENPDRGLPEDIRRFVAEHISSVEQAEVLLLLSAHPGQFWNAETVNRTIQSSLSSVSQRLKDLFQEGFLAMRGTADPEYQYAPKSEELAHNVTRFLAAYKERRIKVIELIFARPSDQVRSFSDAFKFKKE